LAGPYFLDVEANKPVFSVISSLFIIAAPINYNDEPPPPYKFPISFLIKAELPLAPTT